jgi:AcrR family transcriptional regulator
LIWYGVPMSAARTARERARAELVGEIKQVARRQLAEHGAAALSVRAVSRELGMVSSAIYRYFPSRDQLLTALIIDAYDAAGAAAEAAAAKRRRGDFTGRWLATARAVRRWALAHPREYALIYGSPIPGYVAPEETIGPASRVGVVLVGVLTDALEAGELQPPSPAARIPRALGKDVDRLREDLMPGVPDELVLRAIFAWTHLYGTLSFELFGHYHNVIDARDAAFDHTMLTLAALVGLPAS